MCTGQTNMSSDPIRTLFVTLHNKHRSEIAKGAVIMGDGNKCRTAVHMWKLGYKCELETSAYRAAEGCYKGDSSTQGVDEVWHVFDTSPSDMNKAAEEVRLWNSKLVKLLKVIAGSHASGLDIRLALTERGSCQVFIVLLKKVDCVTAPSPRGLNDGCGESMSQMRGSSRSHSDSAAATL
ncbi:hypothetical protein Y032_0105g3671 [Ancylostoma ceylanicum]|uniref:SCP domain-containing protein n=1 Tax=Ancylostoma ceylanicum TaxID=53326 RepID=A0A016TG20_9BILA|nr:hypothetical protein Y032_0105g3671 [Ancylostoma ceylanicum]